MEFNGFNILSSFFLILLYFPATQATFEFINNLKGCHKGTHSKDVYQLKTYLHKFGYLSLNPTGSNDNAFDDALEVAIKTYQNNFHLNPSGIIDEATAATMMTPRCGVADIVHGTNFMRDKNKTEPSSSTFHTVAHYTFFPGSPRWPSGQTALTYGFMPNVPSEVVGPVGRAFGNWASVSIFTFSQVQNFQDANLVIGWYSGDHGDGTPFDGPGGFFAHAFPPTDGRFHYDADETWSTEPMPGAFHLESAANHEIGHLLGLDHSSVQAAIMWPIIPPGETKSLDADDINGITALYSS